MTNKERYQRTFSALHASGDFLTEVQTMNEGKRRHIPRLTVLVAAVVLVAALAATAYAANIGGIRRTVQIWMHGDQTNAVLDLQQDGNTASYTLTYEDANGETHEMEGGGIAYEGFGRERPLTEEEILEQLDMPDVEYQDDGTVWVYWRSHAMEITDRFEDGICYVKLVDGDETQYVTVKYNNGYSTSPDAYPNPHSFN
ncbi:MAG: hypothetical protein IJ112_05205 [Oscillospiraceae bacterium]|nr:hypothetical protein [Oscillospiraceae bacterium]